MSLNRATVEIKGETLDFADELDEISLQILQESPAIFLAMHDVVLKEEAGKDTSVELKGIWLEPASSDWKVLLVLRFMNSDETLKFVFDDKQEAIEFMKACLETWQSGSNPSFRHLESLLRGWAEERDLMDEDNSSMQLVKTMEELGELAHEHTRGYANADKVVDAIGDILVTLIIYAYDIDLREEIDIPAQQSILLYCLQRAWDEIKDRKGKIKNGSFVKE